MKVSLVSSTILFLATCLDSVSTTPVVSACCDQWSSTMVHADRIQGYYVQRSGLCPVRAIVFNTSSGKRICSDPDNAWAKSTMKKVDARNRPNAGGLPTTAAPKTTNAGGLPTTAALKTTNSGGLPTTAPPPKTTNAGGLATTAAPKTTNAGGLPTTAPPPKTTNAGWSYSYKTLLLNAIIIYVFNYLI